jgi:hypothetical protein
MGKKQDISLEANVCQNFGYGLIEIPRKYPPILAKNTESITLNMFAFLLGHCLPAFILGFLAGKENEM